MIILVVCAGCAVVVAGVCLFGSASASPRQSAAESPGVPRRSAEEVGPARMYGDSLTYQARKNLAFLYAATHHHQSLKVGSMGGTALCDWAPTIVRDLTALPPPKSVTLEFSGNNVTSCMGAFMGTGGFAAGSPAFFDAYRASLGQVMAAARRARVRVFWAEPPVRPSDAVIPRLNDDFAAMARTSGATVIDGSRSVADAAGRWTATLPCGLHEGVAEGCVDGTIPVRSRDRLHFTDTPDAYSGGSVRWSEATVTGIP